jgi:hypothetical protein
MIAGRGNAQNRVCTAKIAIRNFQKADDYKKSVIVILTKSGVFGSGTPLPGTNLH